MDPTIGAFLLPAALVLGAPASLGSFERGLYCETPELLELVVGVADRGGDAAKAVAAVNKKHDSRVCLYSADRDIRVQQVRFERTIAANHTVYAIYQVNITALGRQKTEIGPLSWQFSQPLPMYTLRPMREDRVERGAKP